MVETKMPDDLADVERRVLARLEEHKKKMENDPEYRDRYLKQLEYDKANSRRIFPVSIF